MTETMPKVDPKGRYELKAAAEALELNRTTLCHYRKKGLIKAERRVTNGRAVYTGAEIIRFWKATM